MSEENSNENDGSKAIGIYSNINGVVLDINDGEGSNIAFELSADDASRVAVNLITNVVMFQMNQAMRMAAERAEMERLRSAILSGDPSKTGGIVDPFKK